MTGIALPTRRSRARALVALACGALLTLTFAVPSSPASSAGAAPDIPAGAWRDDFDGPSLSGEYDVVNRDDSAWSLSDGTLRVSAPAGDTYQTNNTAKNMFMVDIPAGDFTAIAAVAAPVAKIYQGAGLIAWSDMDNYVRSGLTYVGSLSPSGIAIENDVETGAVFTAASFTNRPGSSGEVFRLQRAGDTITTSYWDEAGGTWVTAGTVQAPFATTQVGLYALGAVDGTVLPAAFDYFAVDAAEGQDVQPSGTFTLKGTGTATHLVETAAGLGLSEEPPLVTLALTSQDAGDGAVLLSTAADDEPVVVSDGHLALGSPSDAPTALRLTDAGGGKLFLRAADDDTAFFGLDDVGALVLGTEADAVKLKLQTVSSSRATLAIDGDASAAQISDTMFGIFYEDINYAADGGLYAELVRNRAFEFNSTDNGSFTGLTGWQVLNRSNAGTTGSVVDDEGRLNPMNRNYLSLSASAAGDGVRNVGFNTGIAVQQGKKYTASVWARTATAQDLTLRVEDNAGTAVLATGTVAVDGNLEWKKYDVELTATQTSDAGRYAVLAGAPSTIALDMVSLMPQDTWVGPVNGRSVLRKDLAEKIAAMKPAFLRFPGGCVTNVGTFKSYEESNYADRRRTYQWKETIGPVEERPTNKNFWGYNQSYGIGYLEYFEFAEDLGAEPLPVLSVGANGCGSSIPEMHDPDLIDRWVQDTVDLVEFANGGTDTTWGSIRAELGHPEPFGLEMIGLGNEENTTTFEANFPEFRDAVKARYPDLKIVSNSGPDDAGARFESLWDFNRAQQVDLVDEHYYNDPSWFLANNHRYDSYDREGPQVFLGEYASRGNTFGNALAEASYMTGLERNADVVRLASYAPLLANESYVQWTPDAIWFDNDESWGSANYYVQKMFGENVGDEVVPSTFDGAVNQPDDIAGGVFLSTWSTSAAYDNVTVTSNDTGDLLFSDQFADASQWSPQSGSWSASGGRYVQSSTSVNDARSIVSGAYTKDWSNYTLELDATKLAGNEGFLVGFGAQGTNDFYWWNLGGWGNTRSVLQRADGGSAGEVKALEGKSITTGQTYHVKVVVDGHTIELYLDGELQMTYDESAATEKLFQVVTRDKASGDLVAKVVNTSDQTVRTDVSVSDVEVLPTARVTQMTASSRSDANTKANPTKVVPVRRDVSGLSSSFTYDFPPSSITFVRMHTADATAPVVGDVSLEGDEANGYYAEPVTVRATATDDRQVDGLELSVDGGPWLVRAGDSGSVEVTGDGSHTVEVRAIDAAGNVGEIRPVTFAIDAAAPVSNASVDAVARTVSLRAADNGAGVDRIEYRSGTSGDWMSYDGPVQVGDAETTVQFRAVDVLGNTEEPGTVVVPAAGTSLASSTMVATVPSSTVRYGSTVPVSVKVAGARGVPTGDVRVVAGAMLVGSGRLVDGVVTIPVDTLDLGTGTVGLVVTYLGDSTYASSQDTLNLRVTKARSKTAARTPVVSPARGAVIRVQVTTTPMVAATGRVTVRVAANGATYAREVGRVPASGSVDLTLPRLERGSYTVSTTYAGSPTVEGSSTRTTLSVR